MNLSTDYKKYFFQHLSTKVPSVKSTATDEKEAKMVFGRWDFRRQFVDRLTKDRIFLSNAHQKTKRLIPNHWYSDGNLDYRQNFKHCR